MKDELKIMIQSKPVYAFYEHQPDITISLTLYSKMQELSRRKFYLRNLTGTSEDEQVEEAAYIMNGVAQEIYYLSGYGVDSGVVKVAGRKALEITYPEFTTDIYYFRQGALFKFTPVQYYAWVKGSGKNYRIAEHLHEANDQVHL